MEADYDLGQQQPISAKSGSLGAYVIADAGPNYTSNPTLANGGGRGDMYFCGARRRGHLSQSCPGPLPRRTCVAGCLPIRPVLLLNFTRFNVGGGLDYVFESLGRLTASCAMIMSASSMGIRSTSFT